MLLLVSKLSAISFQQEGRGIGEPENRGIGESQAISPVLPCSVSPILSV